MIERKAAGGKIKIVLFWPKKPTREDELVRVLEESIKRLSKEINGNLFLACGGCR